jgi:hypothetical protein
VDGGMLWGNRCDGKVLRCGAGNRHQHAHPVPCTVYDAMLYSKILYCTVLNCTYLYSAAVPYSTRTGPVELEVLMWYDTERASVALIYLRCYTASFILTPSWLLGTIFGLQWP